MQAVLNRRPSALAALSSSRARRTQNRGKRWRFLKKSGKKSCVRLVKERLNMETETFAASIRGETPQTLAQKLAVINYKSVALPKLCRNCGAPLKEGQPVGAFCQDCARVQAAIDAGDCREDEAAGGALICAFLIGVGAAIGFTVRCFL